MQSGYNALNLSFPLRKTTTLTTKTPNKAGLLHLLSPQFNLLALHERAISSPDAITRENTCCLEGYRLKLYIQTLRGLVWISHCQISKKLQIPWVRECVRNHSFKPMEKRESLQPSEVRLRGMTKASAGPCMVVGSVCRKCPPQLSAPRYLWPEDCSPIKNSSTKISQTCPLIQLYTINPTPLFMCTNNLASLFIYMQLPVLPTQLYVVNMLSSPGATVSPSESPVHLITVFLCSSVSPHFLATSVRSSPQDHVKDSAEPDVWEDTILPFY